MLHNSKAAASSSGWRAAPVQATVSPSSTRRSVPLHDGLGRTAQSARECCCCASSSSLASGLASAPRPVRAKHTPSLVARFKDGGSGTEAEPAGRPQQLATGRQASAEQQQAAAEASPPSSGDAAQGDSVPVVFELGKHCAYGHSFAIIGEAPALGSWQPQHAARLEWSEGDVWHASVPLPVSSRIPFKYIELGPQGQLLGWGTDLCEGGNMAVTVEPAQQQNSASGFSVTLDPPMPTASDVAVDAADPAPTTQPYLVARLDMADALPRSAAAFQQQSTAEAAGLSSDAAAAGRMLTSVDNYDPSSGGSSAAEDGSSSSTKLDAAAEDEDDWVPAGPPAPAAAAADTARPSQPGGTGAPTATALGQGAANGSSSSSSGKQDVLSSLSIKPVQPPGAPLTPYSLSEPPAAGAATKLVSAGPSCSSVDLNTPVGHPGKAVVEVLAGPAKVAASGSSSSSGKQDVLSSLSIKPVQPPGAPQTPYALPGPPAGGAATKLVSASLSCSTIDFDAAIAHPGKAVVEVLAGPGAPPLQLLDDVAGQLQQPAATPAAEQPAAADRRVNALTAEQGSASTRSEAEGHEQSSAATSMMSIDEERLAAAVAAAAAAAATVRYAGGAAAAVVEEVAEAVDARNALLQGPHATPVQQVMTDAQGSAEAGRPGSAALQQQSQAKQGQQQQ